MSKVLPARPKNTQPQPTCRFESKKRKNQQATFQTVRVSRDTNETLQNGYLSDGTGSRRPNRHQQPPQVFLQFQTSPDAVISSKHHHHHHQQKINITRSRSREPIQFYNDLNLEQLDRHGATLEIARCSTSKSSRASYCQI